MINLARFKPQIIIAGFLLAVYFIQQVFYIPVSLDASLNFLSSDPKDVVAVLVEKQLYEDERSYQGLSGSFNTLEEGNLGQRIRRYTDDIRSKVDADTIAILPIPKETSAIAIASMLKQAYFGNFSPLNQQQLKGVIIIGDLPLPVVKAENQNFVSLMPYTDFVDPRVVLSPESQTFTLQEEVVDPTPEIWHGLISFRQARGQYAEFFDKNHLYHSNHQKFAATNLDGLLIAEPNFDAKMLSQDALQSYERYRQVAPLILRNKVNGKLTEALQSQLELPFETPDTAPPDLSAGAMVSTMAMDLSKLFAQQVAKHDDAASQTGRYANSQLVTPFTAMFKTDYLAQTYLNQIYEMVRKEILTIALQEQVDMKRVKGARLSGTIELEGGRSVNISSQKFVNHGRQTGLLESLGNRIKEIPGVGLLVQTLGLNLKEIVFEAEEHFGNIDSIEESIQNSYFEKHEPMVFGRNLKDIDQASQCPVMYGGGLRNALDKTVRSSIIKKSVINEQGEPTEACFKSIALDPDGLIKYKGFDEDEQDQKQYCSNFSAQGNVRNAFVLDSVELDYPSSLTHESCFAFRKLKTYMNEFKRTSNNNLSTADKPLDANSINLGAGLSLGQILPALEGFTGVDSLDWHAFSSHILANPVKDEFELIKPLGDDSPIKKVTLNVSKTLIEEGGSFKSLMLHDYPKPSNVSKAIMSGASDLPFDQKAYITFVDKLGNKQQKILPDPFQLNSYEAFMQELESIEEFFTSISKNNTNYQNRLQNLFIAQERYEDPNDKDSQLLKAKSSKAKYLMDFMGLDLNQKFQRIFKDIQNQNFDSDLVLASPQKIDLAFITGDMNQDGLLFDFPVVDSDLDREIKAFKQPQQPSATTDSESDCTQGSLGIRCLFDFDQLRSPYFQDYLPQWKDEQASRLEGLVDFVTPEFESFSKTHPLIKNPVDDVTFKAPRLLPQGQKVNLKLTALDNRQVPIFEPSGKFFLKATGPVTVLLEAEDLDGQQVYPVAFNGTEFTLPLRLDNPGQVKLELMHQAGFFKSVFEHSFNIEARYSIQLSSASINETAAEPSNNTISLSVVDSNGQTVVSEPPSFSLEGDKVAGVELESQEPAMSHELKVSTGALGGQANLNITFDPLETQLPINVEYLNAEFLKLLDPKINLYKPNQTVSTKVQLLDAYGNPTSKVPDVTLTNLTPNKLELLTPQLSFVESRAQIQLKSKGEPRGKAYLKLAFDNFETILTVNFRSNLNLLSDNFDSKVLTYNLATDVNLFDQNLTYQLLNNGRTQAMHILARDLSEAPIFGEISSLGALTKLSNNLQLESKLLDQTFTTNLYDQNQIKITSLQFDLSDINFSQNTTDQSIAYISNLHPLASTSNSLLNFDSEIAFNFNNLAQGNGVNILQNLESDIFAFDVIKGTERVATINVPNLPSDKFLLQPNYQNSNFKFKVNYTGSDTSQAKSFSLVGSGQNAINPAILRAENRYNQELVGFNETDKSNLLFASGLSFGESFQAYQADSSIVLGDPMVRLSVPSSEQTSKFKFNKTLGEFKGRLDGTLNQISDSQKFILISDSKGQISIFDKQTQSFHKNILSLHSDILNILEFKVQNQSRFLIHTADNCYVDDSCLLILNPNQDNQITPVVLPTNIKPKQVFIGQANRDNVDDLFILNQDNSLYLSLSGRSNFQTASKIGSAKPQIANNGRVLPLAITYHELRDRAVQFKTFQPAPNSNYVRIQDQNRGFLEDKDPVSLSIRLVNPSTEHSSDFKIRLPRYLQVKNSNDFAKNNQAELSLNAGQVRTLNFQAEFDYAYYQSPVVHLTRNPDSPTNDDLSDIQVSLGEDELIFYNSNLNNNRISYVRQTKVLPQEQIAPNQTPELMQTAFELASAESDRARKIAAGKTLNALATKDSDGDGFADMYDASSKKLNKVGDELSKQIEKFQCDGGCLAIPINESFLTPFAGLPGSPIFGASLAPPFAAFGPPAALLPLHTYLSPTLTGELYMAPCYGIFPAAMCFPLKITDLGDACDSINKQILKYANKAVGYAKSGLDEASGRVISLGDPAQNLPKPHTPIAGFPGFLTDWLFNQMNEINKLIDMPDLTIVYPRIDQLFTRVTDQKTEEQLRKQQQIQDPKANIYSLCKPFVPYTDICGNVGTEKEFEAIKNSAGVHYKLQNYAKSLENDFATLPIINVKPVPTQISYPYISESELYRFLGFINRNIDSLATTFKDAINDWQCLESNRQVGANQVETERAFKKLFEQGDGSDYKALILRNFQNNEDEPTPRFTSKTFTKKGESTTEFIIDMLLYGRMTSYMAAKQDPATTNGKACLDLVAGFGGLLGNLDKNLQTIQKYRDIPLEIFEIQNFLAVYASTILDYGITTLETFYGWITRQVDVMSNWVSAIENIMKIFDSFKLVLQLFVDFQNNCDTCRSNRTNLGLDLVMKLLFSALPDIPVIAFPKVPNLTLDVSELSAGFTFELPELKFTPNYLTLPDIELTIDLPERPPVALDVQIEGYKMPLLPEPPNIKALIDFPALPSLAWPKLPDLPQPPEVGKIGFELEGKLRTIVEPLSAALRIYCLFIKGLMPVPSPLLKTQIESMSNRPLSPVLPIDLSFAIEMPNVPFEYVSEIQGILTSDLRFEFPQIANLVKQFTQEVDKFSIEAKNSIQNSLKDFEELTTVELKILPALEELDLTEKVDVELPDDSQAYLMEIKPESIGTPLKLQKFNIAELEKRMQALPAKLTKQLEPLYLAAKGESIEFNQATHLVADTQTKLSETPKLVSQKIAFSPGAQEQGFSLEPVTPNKGILIEDNQGQVFDLISYNLSDTSGVKVTMADLDQDQDPDVMYNLGQDIFIKYNQDRANNQIKTAQIQEIQFDSYKDGMASSLPLQDLPFELSPAVNQVTLTQPESLKDQILVLDTYLADFEEPKAHNRYILNPLDSQDRVQVLSDYEFGDQVTISKGDFQNIVLLPSLSQAISLPLENNPYLVLPSYYNLATNKIEVLNTTIPVTPSECYDRVPPDIEVNQNQLFNLGLYQRATINLEGSVDKETEIVKLYLDSNLEEDKDLDGDPLNDIDLIGTQSQITNKFRIGPFAETQSRSFMIHAIDKVGNRSSKQVNLKVNTPAIILNEIKDGKVTGEIKPNFEGAPIEIVRQRGSKTEVLAELTSNSQGEFELDLDLNSETNNAVTIADRNQVEHFRIHKQRGTVQKLTAQAQIQVAPATDNSFTNINLMVGTQQVSTLQRIADPNLDVVLDNQSPNQTILSEVFATSVFDTQTEDDFTAKIIPPNNDSFFGGAGIFDQQKLIATVDKEGAIKILDNSLQIALSEVEDLNQLQTFKLIKGQQVLFEIYIPLNSDTQLKIDKQEFTTRNLESAADPTPEEQLPENPKEPEAKQFTDVPSSHPNFEAINYLLEQGVLSGNSGANGLEFNPERLINRAEYAKVILKLLCIEPSKPAYKKPAVFSDVPFQKPNLWYYPITKENYLQGFFEGYLGEIDPITKLAPFKPANNITRIEAAKVIMEALSTIGKLDISEIPYLDPWYKEFLRASQDLNPFLTEENAKQVFLITKEESKTPEAFITRAEFAEMAYRTLSISNCLISQGSDISADSETADLAEQATESQDPSQSDQDESEVETIGLTGQDPAGEIGYQGTNPTINLEEVVCNSCPCAYTIKDNATISEQDQMFAILRNRDQSSIINISNKIQLEDN